MRPGAVSPTNPSRPSRVQEMFDAYGVLTEAWDGENIHLGVFVTPDEPFAAAAERATARLAEAAALQPGDDVLETACGIGGAARYLARNLGVRVTATNISEGQLELGRERTQREGLAELVRFEQADFQKLPFAGSSFDCYWCQESWLYAADKDAAVREAFRVLKPGGRLVVSEFVLARELPAELERDLLEAVANPGFWSRPAYERALGRAGFEHVESEDWSEHGAPSWERVLGTLQARRSRFVSRLGTEIVEATTVRFELWLRAFRAGNLGWVFFRARKPL
jgi:sarcosine/dimethylglycine N-methyltransferase